jgi:acyl transferase domain-containing protein/NADPH:quinone reductase-like Zn-dependent oxidoreductase/SAM-dependent methyltransferase
LTGLHEACQALQHGICSSAIVGGTNIIITPRMTVAMTEWGVLSPSGSCKSFDANADGYARGEAVSALYIKKLSDAVRDGDPIRAVIRSTCVNHDGKTLGLSNPNAEAHETLIRQGHQLAGITDFSKTAMMECHGTGTKVGDPIETKAVANVFGNDGIYIGSVKPNLGHSEGASGLSSVIKMVLALEHRTIPPNINFKTPNPEIPWKEAKLKVPTHPVPWPADRAERVGVNSFGIGGANAHVLLESAASFGLGRAVSPMDTNDEDRPKLLLFSATHPDSLRRSVENHASYLASHPGSLNDLSYTLSSKRQPHALKGFCVAYEDKPFELSRITKPEGTPNVIFAFTGQGAQFARMGHELFLHEPSFAATIRGLDATLASLPEPPSWTIEDEILKAKPKSRLSEAEFSQPCCTAIQVALVDILTKWGIKPAGVVGHSSGEIGAAYAAGVLTAPEAIVVAYYRGLATVGLNRTHRGGMAAIGLGREAVTPYLRPGVIIGCENSPESTTLTGDLDILRQIMEEIRKNDSDILVRALHVECAYHSHHMRKAAVKYSSLLEKNICAKSPIIPFFSSVSGRLSRTEEILSPSYWVQNLDSPVLFYSAVSAAIESLESPQCFLEIGPHSALAGPIRQIIRKHGTDASYIPTLVRNIDALDCLLKTAGELWIRNSDLNPDAINPGGQLLTDLPTYPWTYEGEFWNESRLSKEWRQKMFPHHELLGDRFVGSSELGPTWRNILRLESVPWIQDHEIAHDVLFPAAGYISIVGEAIRQLSGRRDYTVRGVSFLSALIVTGDQPIELQTHLHKLRLTDSLDSRWYEFTIASLNNGVWNKHCAGQVRDAFESSLPSRDIDPLPRKVPSSAWYRVMAKFGLAYGPRFRGLQDISAAVSERKAVATLTDSSKEGEALYQLHPATIDSAFHLLGCAAFNGVGRSFDRLSVPTYIQELYIKPPTKENIIIEAEATPSSTGGMTGNIIGISAGETVFGLKGLRMSPLEDNGEGTNDDTDAAVELEWKSDVNLLDATKLMRPSKDITDIHNLIEKLALSCMIESRVQLLNVDTAHGHLKKFLEWLGTRQALALQGQYPGVDDCAAIASMSSTHRVKLIEDLLAESTNTEASAPAIAIHRIFKRSKSIFEGSTEALAVLMEDNILTQVYDFMQLWDDAELFELLGHYKPNMKILEIGAGTGSRTSTILPHLKSAYGERMFGSYTYTDISAGFFVQAKERFRDYQGIHYAVLDISQDPTQQGFEPESFDLVVATNVLHATPSLEQTLTNVRKLLKPHGRLFFQELCPTKKWINYVVGVLPGWWLGDEDGRSTEPYVNPARWDEELKRTGFGGVDSLAYDGHLMNNIIARPARKEKPRRLTILRKECSGLLMDRIVQSFTDKSYEIDFCSLDQTPKAGQDILSILDISAPFLFSASEQDFAAFKRFISHIEDSGILWVTGASQIHCHNPDYSLILGLARTIRNETGKGFATLELDSFEDSKAWATTVNVFHEFRHRVQDDADNASDFEFVYTDDRVQIGRFHWINVSEQLKAIKDTSHPRRLDIGRSGLLQTLNWKQEKSTELAGNWVQVETRAVGLNFKDVLMAMGIVDIGEEGLGCERSGIVTKIGPDVKYLKQGDRVLCCGGGSFSTSLSMTELCCAKIPESLSFVEAATIPITYSTVIYGLMDIAHLSKGQTVLIHSAAGGVGICALQIAKMIGAEIFCTVGNQEKVDFIMRTFDIPRNRIFNSRDLSFLSDVLRETNQQGVDVVLNSLSGELLHASWKCVAEFGTMIEIGKRDLVGHGNLAMDYFEQNRTYAGVDLSLVIAKRPHIIHDLLRRAVLFYEQGHIKPITPVREFEAIHVEEAMRHMQKGQHIGKIVVTMPNDPSELPGKPSTMSLVLRPDVSYLFVGGFGGLGRSIASWMVEKGARQIIFFSRSAGKVTAEDPYVKELVAQGCSVQTFSGSVSNAADVRKVVSSAEKPIAGVLQASMVLDVSFEIPTLYAS